MKFWLCLFLIVSWMATATPPFQDVFNGLPNKAPILSVIDDLDKLSAVVKIKAYEKKGLSNLANQQKIARFLALRYPAYARWTAMEALKRSGSSHFGIHDKLFKISSKDEDIPIQIEALVTLSHLPISPMAEDMLGGAFTTDKDIQFLVTLWSIHEKLYLNSLQESHNSNINDITINSNATGVTIQDPKIGAIFLNWNHLESPVVRTVTDKEQINHALLYMMFWKYWYLGLSSLSGPKLMEILDQLQSMPLDPFMQEKLATVMSHPHVYQMWIKYLSYKNGHKDKKEDVHFNHFIKRMPYDWVDFKMKERMVEPALKLKRRLFPPQERVILMEQSNKLTQLHAIALNNLSTQKKITEFLAPGYPLSIRLKAISILENVLFHYNKQIAGDLLFTALFDPVHLVQARAILLLDSMKDELPSSMKWRLDSARIRQENAWLLKAWEWEQYFVSQMAKKPSTGTQPKSENERSKPSREGCNGAF